ncbi:MAG: alpha-hydroxy-acid oxidizing protein [Pseudonocardiaceae bacterium]|nr:alpha-hydroxy-acid oxidizing protein [Pseudonocardiaceae bacterium]
MGAGMSRAVRQTPHQDRTAEGIRTPPSERRRLASLSELESAARAALGKEAWTYLDAGAGCETTLAENRAAFDRWHLLPRPLSGVGEVRTTTEFLGLELATPLVTGPVGTYSAFHAGGDVAVARAAQRCGTAAIVPVLSSYSLEETAAAAPGAAGIFQALASGSEEGFVELAHRAQAAGYAVICLTIDAYPRGVRDRIASTGLELPEDAFAANFGGDIETEIGRHIELGRDAWSWTTVRQLIDEIDLPVMIKGVLTPETAEAAVAAGARAVMVSNVGGRQLDGAPSSLEQLPDIVDAVGSAVRIAFDSGVRRGTDALKALALGAEIISLGRTIAMGLAAGGEEGVVASLKLVHEELVTSMALCGIGDVGTIDTSILQGATRPTIGNQGSPR